MVFETAFLLFYFCQVFISLFITVHTYDLILLHFRMCTLSLGLFSSTLRSHAANILPCFYCPHICNPYFNNSFQIFGMSFLIIFLKMSNPMTLHKKALNCGSGCAVRLTITGYHKYMGSHILCWICMWLYPPAGMLFIFPNYSHESLDVVLW